MEIEKAISKANKELAKNPIPAGLLKITNYYDNVKMLWELNPFFYDKSKIYWQWDKKEFSWKMVDETDILIMIDKTLSFGGQLTTGKVKSNYLEAFKQVGRYNIPEDAPKTWVQFKDKIIDIKTKKIFQATPKYFICNPVPWEVGKSIETPIIDSLFKEWVGEKYFQTLKEIIAYCCLADYPIHRIFCFVGSGRNGKSQFQKIIYKFIGADNVASACLDKLASPQQRFEKSKLFKKLVCLLGETNFGTMENTSTLKQLSGGDLIDYEFKNKNPFTGINYATILVNSNSLPSSHDTSDGFYRRWVIIDFPNEFPEGKDIVETIPEHEYNNLARMVIETLPQLFERGKFTNEGTIQERKENYIMASNPLPFFIKYFCECADDLFCKGADLYTAYVQFLNINKRRKVSKKEFYNSLTDDGFIAERTNKRMPDGNYIKTQFIESIALISDWKLKVHELSQKTENEKIVKIVKSHKILNSFLRIEKELEKRWLLTILTNPKTKYSYQCLKPLINSVDEVLFHLKHYEECAKRNGDTLSCPTEQLKEDLGISDKLIEKMLRDGQIMENPAGMIKRL